MDERKVLSEMRGVKIRPLDPANNTPRGMRTFEMKGDILFVREGDIKMIPLYNRNDGEHFGAHYHRGEDPSKNPENLLLLRGSVRARFRRFREIDGDEEFRVTIEAPAQIIIEPFVIHSFDAVGGDVTMIEIRTTLFDPDHPDTFPVAEE